MCYPASFAHIACVVEALEGKYDNSCASVLNRQGLFGEDRGPRGTALDTLKPFGSRSLVTAVIKGLIGLVLSNPSTVTWGGYKTFNDLK